MTTFSRYDAWRTTPPDDDLWTCDCGEENNGDEECRECGEPRRDLHQEAIDREADEEYDRMKEGY